MAKADSAQRYDRQLRLWKAHGQARLEASHILLLGATAAGTELLKNLVLPGIGEVTIVDDQPVTGNDVGNNFFVQSTAATDRRCEVVAANLRELNEDVHIHAVFEDPERYIQRNSNTLSRFSLISTSLPRATLHNTLSTACWQQRIPLVAITLAGFVGYLRIQVREHTVIESHADVKDDLRLDRPFPALEHLAATFDLDCADSMEHGHIPYAIILLKFYQCWRTENPDKARMSFADKKAVRYAITQAMRNSDEENFEEAEKNALRALNPTEIPSAIQALFDCSACQNLTSQSPDFWIIVRALRDFVQQEGEGQLPVSGGVPDMKTDTVSYVKLQSA
ncbi:NEDD8-activating enzyme E1 regulatory subunit [Tieghemiomyces parasiticus]|uniref:NEDD8-activating enzyme E1 regulatory subunit n=1 Tax=Tieghemiomyces parasiticus TaxID=78921 RepID=A0A9W8DM16_9FUNG|nr:NEDD8-activating enzyme E1 regulatory subunit [Tieghemiomyces parasiticus]